MTLLDFANCIGSKSDSKTSYVSGVVMRKEMYPCFYRCLFYNVSLWGKVFLGSSVSHDDIIRLFNHNETWIRNLVLFPGDCFWLFGANQHLHD